MHPSDLRSLHSRLPLYVIAMACGAISLVSVGCDGGPDAPGDSGPLADSSTVADSGSTRDSGSLADSSTVADSGASSDSGAPDSSVVDSGVGDSAVPPSRGAAVLNFSDLISGPGRGLGDGLGSGVIVTLWGQNLGATQGTSTVEFTDASGTTTTAAYVYYWKNADGNLPGGPANLYASHLMQEVAFSIPDAASGAGTIQVTVDGVRSNTLPFTIRDGAIYHVRAGGSATGDGSFGAAWAEVNAVLRRVDAPGATIYVHDSLVSDASLRRAIYWNNTSASSGLANQFGLVAYPGSHPSAVGYSGILGYRTSGLVVSKYSVFASNCDEDAQGQPINCASGSSRNKSMGIQASAYGRAVANTVTDRPGGCVNGQQAAIVGNHLNGDRVSSYQILGNEVHDYGCVGTTKFQHTTYLSVRSGSANIQVDPWRFGWNYLHDNHTKNGIHQYDENQSGELCGSPNDTVIINDNVIINQSGAGISVGASCPWTNDFRIYNNVLVNVGLAADWDGVDPATSNGPNTGAFSIRDGGLSGTISIFNNTIYTWNDDDQVADTQACLGMQGRGDVVTVLWNDNVCHTEKDKPFVAAGCCGAEVELDNVAGANNTWYFGGVSGTRAMAPSWDSTASLADPLLSVGTRIQVGAGSPLIGRSSGSGLLYDIYGVVRPADSEVGAVQFVSAP